MHWSELLKASQLFRENEPRAHFYDEYMEDKKWQSWDYPGIPDAEIERLFLFLNQWSTHYPSGLEAVRGFKQVYQGIFPLVQAIKDETLETLNFRRQIYEDLACSEAIRCIFEKIATCGYRYESTGASKILHTINPSLFVMWDDSIRGGYAVGGSAYEYGYKFLPRVQKELTEAIESYMKDKICDRNTAVSTICRLAHAQYLTKLVDEYNYTKFTLRLDELWEC